MLAHGHERHSDGGVHSADHEVPHCRKEGEGDDGGHDDDYDGGHDDDDECMVMMMAMTNDDDDDDDGDGDYDCGNDDVGTGICFFLATNVVPIPQSDNIEALVLP